METLRVVTEDPKREQWRLINQYSYATNIRRYATDKGLPPHSQPDVDYISGSIRQAHAYFLAAENAPLDISPLLAYYGAVNLLTGIAALQGGARLDINNHGMKLDIAPGLSRLSDAKVIPKGGTSGCLKALTTFYSTGTTIENGIEWSVAELLSSIPDIKSDFRHCFPREVTYCVETTILNRNGVEFERVEIVDFVGYSDPLVALASVDGFSKSYLPPQRPGGLYIILNRRIGASLIGAHSISGKKHLLLGHSKGSRVVCPSHLISLLMALFAMGHLSRYYPEYWNPFVQADATGERAVIEKLIDVSLRYVPNLALDRLLAKQVQFVFDKGDS